MASGDSAAISAPLTNFVVAPTLTSLPPATPAAVRTGSSSLLARSLFIVSAAIFTLLSRYIYSDVVGSAGLFDYMGVRVLPASPAQLNAFFILAILPAFWLAVHLRRPSDVVQLFLYYAVYVQAATLMPLVSYSTMEQ